MRGSTYKDDRSIYALTTGQSRCSKQTQSSIEGCRATIDRNRYTDLVSIRNESKSFLFHSRRTSALSKKIISSGHLRFREDFDSSAFKKWSKKCGLTANNYNSTRVGEGSTLLTFETISVSDSEFGVLIERKMN